MEIRLLDDRDTWNSWVGEQPVGDILQSYDWGEFKSSLGWKTLRLAVLDKSKNGCSQNGRGRVAACAQVFLRRIPIGTIAYCPRGPLFDPAYPEPAGKLLEAIHDICRREGAICLKVEPPLRDSASGHRTFIEWGFRRGDEIQPRSTLVVDLSHDLASLSTRLDIKTRYNIGLAGRKGVRVVEAGDDGAVIFHSLLQATSQRAGFSIHSLEYYDKVWRLLRSRNMAQLLLATYDDEVLSGAMLFRLANHAYYMYGASSGQRRNLKPSDLLQWECLKWAKSVGCTTYDMWGIPDEVGQAVAAGRSVEDLYKGMGNGKNGLAQRGSNGAKGKGARDGESLWGVYRFKRGFGGDVIRFVGAYDYVYSASRYLLWVRSMPLLRQFVSKVGRVRYLDKVGAT